jgi:transcriptional regulator with XRE-family HTH domain
MATTYPISFSAQLRQHLRALRKKRGLTQAQLGVLVGVSQVRIAEIEANPGLVSFDQLIQLLSVLDVSISLSDPHETRSQNMIDSEVRHDLGSSEKMRRLASRGSLGPDSSEEMRKVAPAASFGLNSSEEMRKVAAAASPGLNFSEEMRKLAAASLGLNSSEEMRKVAAAGLGLNSSEEMHKLAAAAGLGLNKLKKGSW